MTDEGNRADRIFRRTTNDGADGWWYRWDGERKGPFDSVREAETDRAWRRGYDPNSDPKSPLFIP